MPGFIDDFNTKIDPGMMAYLGDEITFVPNPVNKNINLYIDGQSLKGLGTSSNNGSCYQKDIRKLIL